MKLECDKNKLQQAVYLLERIAGKNLSLPILSNILLEVKNKRLVIKATNLDVGVEITLPVLVEKEGVVAVNPYVLNNFLTNLKTKERIKINLINNNLSITTTTSSTLIKSELVDDFPTIPSIKKGNSITLQAQDLVIGLQSVFFASALSDIKPEISSVYIYQESNNLYFVATDSFRLAEKKIPSKENKNNFGQAIIPFKNINEIIRVFSDLESEVVIYGDNNQISFYADNIYLTSRLIDGIYPDYRQIMPKKFKSKINLNKSDLIQGVKLAMVFLNKLNQITISTHSNIKTIEINSQNQDIGENSISIPASVNGEEVVVKLNARYLADSFPSIIQDTIIFSFDESNRIFIQGENDNTFSYIIMPLSR